MTANAKMILLPSLVLFFRSLNVGETPEKTYIVKFSRPEIDMQTLIAARAKIRGDHLVLLNSDGSVAASFLLKMVESMIVSPTT
jgi:hypothetical protein